MAASSFLKVEPKYRLHRAVWEIHSRMNYARYKSIFQGRRYRISFDAHGYNVEFFDKDDQNWEIDVNGSFTNVSIDANNSPVFHPVGTVSDLASIYIFNSWGRYRISLAISGRIKILKIQ
jgi:hypothetical protein